MKIHECKIEDSVVVESPLGTEPLGYLCREPGCGRVGLPRVAPGVWQTCERTESVRSYLGIESELLKASPEDRQPLEDCLALTGPMVIYRALIKHYYSDSAFHSGGWKDPKALELYCETTDLMNTLNGHRNDA